MSRAGVGERPLSEYDVHRTGLVGEVAVVLASQVVHEHVSVLSVWSIHTQGILVVRGCVDGRPGTLCVWLQLVVLGIVVQKVGEVSSQVHCWSDQIDEVVFRPFARNLEPGFILDAIVDSSTADGDDLGEGVVVGVNCVDGWGAPHTHSRPVIHLVTASSDPEGRIYL